MTGIERLVDIVNDGPYSGGMIHISVQKLREICEQIEREVDDISGHESDVLAFVEEHGGLTKLKKQFEASDMSYNRKTFYDRLALGWIEENGGFDEVKKRLMPDGMQWPRFTNGELVDFGSKFQNKRGGASVLRTAIIKDCRDSLGGDFYWKLGKGKNAVTLKSGERVKRPAPKVYDADGVEIREGDTVYLLPGEWCGKYPLHYCSAGDEMVVKNLYPDHELGGVLTCVNKGKCVCFPLPCQLTHTKPEPPDSLDRLWADIEECSVGYESFMRRCKELAERERGE